MYRHFLWILLCTTRINNVLAFFGEYCDCIVTRGGVYDEILPEPERNLEGMLLRLFWDNFTHVFFFKWSAKGALPSFSLPTTCSNVHLPRSCCRYIRKFYWKATNNLYYIIRTYLPSPRFVNTMLQNSTLRNTIVFREPGQVFHHPV